MFKILVVDDEPDLRYVLRRLFERAGHEVIDAGHGAAAWEVVLRTPPDLVVTDMMMPVMDGAELIRKLRGDPATAEIPILAVTGDVQMAGDADAVLSKPWHSHQLLAAVNALMVKKAEQS